MNDTTTTQPATNTPEQHNVLIDSIGKYLVGMIESIVERKVQQIFESHATLALIADRTEQNLRDIAKQVMDEHEGDYEHPSNDEVSDIAMTHIVHHNFDDQIRRSVETLLSDGDYATEERVQEMIDESDYVTESRVHEMVEEQVQEAIDEHDYEESVKQVLRNI
jgi:hypothetical protein